MDHAGRLAGLRASLKALELDGVLISDPINIRYLCGFTGSNAYLFVSEAVALFLTDGRYAIAAAQQVQQARVRVCLGHQEVIYSLGMLVKQDGLSVIGYEGAHVTVASRGSSWEPPPGLDKLEAYFEGSRLVPTRSLVEDLRAVKQAPEIEVIRRAAEMADRAFEYILPKIVPGVPERDLALELEFHLRALGAQAMSFEPIVAAAERSALPHAHPTERVVERGRFVLLDFGCVVDGYCSDMTRTVVVGPVDGRHREVYELVLAAQAAGLEAVGPGVSCGRVDRAARTVIEQAGHAEAFMHGLGHGVGLQIHEAPSLKKDVSDLLEEGHVVTVEPGAYFEGWGGVRVEDLLVVAAGGIQMLSAAPRELIVL